MSVRGCYQCMREDKVSISERGGYQCMREAKVIYVSEMLLPMYEGG